MWARKRQERLEIGAKRILFSSRAGLELEVWWEGRDGFLLVGYSYGKAKNYLERQERKG